MDKNIWFPVLNIVRPPNARILLSVLVLTVPLELVVLDPDRFPVVFPEPRTPSTLMINAALAVEQAKARATSATS